MKMKDLGEFGFIDRIAPLCKINSGDVIRGIGDDCSVVSLSPDLYLLVTTDLLIERVHFLVDWQSAHTLGGKALAVNLSDIAACGGIPRDAFVSIAVPNRLNVDWLEDFYRGMADLADKFKVNILGGDTTRSLTDLVINVVVTGFSNPKETLFRNEAQPEDIIAVSGPLGNSAAGLELLLNPRPIPDTIASPLIYAHISPRPHLTEGRTLAKSHACNAAIDISDGLSSDLGHVCKQSGVGAIIFEEKLPLSEPLIKLARELTVDPLDWVLNGGEDYVLLASIRPDQLTDVMRAAASDGWELIEIGKFVSTPGIKLVRASGETTAIVPRGWDHFKY